MSHRLKQISSFIRSTCSQAVPLLDMNVGSLMIVFVLMIGLSLLWGYGMGRDQPHGFSQIDQKAVAIIDLNKVLRAEAVVASHAMQDPDSQNQQSWLKVLQQSNASLRSAIRDVAGQGRLVLVGPAVLQGGEAITDRVLIKMGLPTKVPDVLPKAADLFPSSALQNKTPVKNPSVNLEKATKGTKETKEVKVEKEMKPGDSSWLQP